jgi:hypothetical protein
MLRDGILTSDRVNALSWPAEVFYRRLMSVVDDYGRFDGRAVILRARCYPLKLDKVSEPDASSWIAECERAGLVRCYAVSEKPYIQVLDFNQRTYGSGSKYPHPPGTTGNHGDSPPYSKAESEAKANKELSNKLDTFDRFWKSYPKKKAKGAARKAFEKGKCADKIEVIVKAIEQQRQSDQWRKDRGQFIPHPATWLNREQWEDELVFSVKPRRDVPDKKAIHERAVWQIVQSIRQAKVNALTPQDVQGAIDAMKDKYRDIPDALKEALEITKDEKILDITTMQPSKPCTEIFLNT